MREYIVADNQYITRKGICSLLENDLGAVTILTAGTGKQLREKLAAHTAAVVIIDYTLFDFASPEQMLIVKTAYPPLLVACFFQ